MPRNIIGRADHGLAFSQWRVLKECIRRSISNYTNATVIEDIKLTMADFTNNDYTTQSVIEQILHIKKKTIILINRLDIIKLRYDFAQRRCSKRKLLFRADALSCLNADWSNWCNEYRTEISQPDVERITTRQSTRSSLLNNSTIETANTNTSVFSIQRASIQSNFYFYSYEILFVMLN